MLTQTERRINYEEAATALADCVRHIEEIRANPESPAAALTAAHHAWVAAYYSLGRTRVEYLDGMRP